MELADTNFRDLPCTSLSVIQLYSPWVWQVVESHAGELLAAEQILVPYRHTVASLQRKSKSCPSPIRPKIYTYWPLSSATTQRKLHPEETHPKRKAVQADTNEYQKLDQTLQCIYDEQGKERTGSYLARATRRIR
jgi:hypothetical protein